MGKPDIKGRGGSLSPRVCQLFLIIYFNRCAKLDCILILFERVPCAVVPRRGEIPTSSPIIRRRNVFISCV